MIIQVSGKSAHLAEKCYFYLKASNKQSWKLYRVKFLPNQVSKNVLKQLH